jgi:hypothetical protein
MPVKQHYHLPGFKKSINLLLSGYGGLAWYQRFVKSCSLFAWLISHQPTVFFSQNKPATINQPAVLFSQNKSAPTISHQPNEQAWMGLFHTIRSLKVEGK